MTVHTNSIMSTIPGWDLPPVIVIAESDAARRRAESAIEDAGWRAVAVPVGEAADRIQQQGAASAVWVEMDGWSPDEVEAFIADASLGQRFPAIVAAPSTMIDPAIAAIGDRSIDLLIDPDAVERVSALALATKGHSAHASVHEVSSEPSAARLRQLSDEVGRIAATLARLSTGPALAALELPVGPSGEAEPTVTGEQVRAVIRARRLRARFFDPELFADPAWDMLLDLFQAEIAQHRVPVSSLCIAADVPPTTALRWIKTMTDVGLFNRRADPHDGRRVFVELAPEASGAMRRYFGQIGSVAA